MEPFVQFFFPDVHADLDWSRGYESLDKELQQIVREGELGPRLADKLFKVWPKDSVELWLLIHVEVQNQPVKGPIAFGPFGAGSERIAWPHELVPASPPSPDTGI